MQYMSLLQSYPLTTPQEMASSSFWAQMEVPLKITPYYHGSYNEICTTHQCTSLAHLYSDITSIIRLAKGATTPFLLAPTTTIHFISFILCHDQFTENFVQNKHDKIQPAHRCSLSKGPKM